MTYKAVDKLVINCRLKYSAFSKLNKLHQRIQNNILQIYKHKRNHNNEGLNEFHRGASKKFKISLNIAHIDCQQYCSNLINYCAFGFQSHNPIMNHRNHKVYVHEYTNFRGKKCFHPHLHCFICLWTHSQFYERVDEIVEPGSKPFSVNFFRILGTFVMRFQAQRFRAGIEGVQFWENSDEERL